MTVHDLFDDLDPDLDPDLERRLRAIVDARAELVSSVTTPDPATVRTRPIALTPGAGERAGRRRRGALAAAAALLAMGVGAAVLAGGGTDEARVRVDPAVTTVPVQSVDGYVVDGWDTPPTDGSQPYAFLIAGSYRAEEQSTERRASYVLGRERPEVLAEVLDLPEMPEWMGLPDGATTVDVDGRTGHVQTYAGAIEFDVALRRGLILRMHSARVDVAAIVALVDAVDHEDGSLVDDALPAGWREFDGHHGLTSIARSVGPSSGQIGWYADRTLSAPELSPGGFAWAEDDDPDAVIDTLEDLWGGEPVDLDGRRGTWILTGNTRTLVWVLGPDRLGWIDTAERPDITTDTDLAEAMARRVRRAGPDEWARVVAVAEWPATNLIALPELSDDATVIERGSTPQVDWEVTFDPGAAAALTRPLPDAIGAGAYEMRLQGRWSNVVRTIVPTTSDWASGPPVASRMPRMFVVTAAVPGDVTGLAAEVDGRTLEAAVVPVEQGAVQLVLATMPSEDLGSDIVVAVVGQHSDGTPFRTESRW